MSDSRVDVEQPSSWEVRWKGLTFKVPDKANGQKTILDDCAGAVRGGQVCGVLGPSGSGKTTLLDALAGRIDGKRKGRTLEGDIAGCERCAYVQQEDSLVGVLTTKETLHTAAALVGGAAARQRADALLDELGLTICADVIVGTILLKGLSGGQKRRLSMAVELVAEPKTLLLDEPTSGLDSASALGVLEKVRDVAGRAAVAVVLTIHQPSHAAWQTLDRVSFMARGRVCYFGDDAGLKAFLATAGAPVPPNRDVAEYVLSLTNEDFPGHGDLDAIVAKFRATRGDDAEAVDQAPPPRRRAGFLTRFAVLCGRGFRELLRDPGVIMVRLAMYAMLSALIGAMYANVGNDKDQESVVARVSVLFYVAAFMVFMSVAVLPFVMLQRDVFVKERMNGHYGVRAGVSQFVCSSHDAVAPQVPEYVLARFVVAVPGVALLAIVTTLLVVFPAKLNGPLVYGLDLFVSLLVAEGFMSLVAACVPHYIIGIALAAGIFGFHMLCEGFFKVKSEIPDYLK